MNIKKRKELEKRCLLVVPTLQKQIGKYVTDYNDQCDILQEAMASAWAKIPDLIKPYNVEGWMMTITKNKCMAWLKSRNKMSHLIPTTI